MKKYDVIAAFMCVLPETLPSNLKIFTRAGELGRDLNIPVLTELDFAHELGWDMESMGAVDWPSTTLKFAKWLVECGYKNILVVAAPYHIRRCLRDFRKLGVSAEADGHFRKCREKLYDKNSWQWRTRSPCQHWPLEIIKRLLPFWLYAKIAG